MVVAKWDHALDTRRMTNVLNGETIQEAEAPEELLVTDARVVAGRR